MKFVEETFQGLTEGPSTTRQALNEESRKNLIIENE